MLVLTRKCQEVVVVGGADGLERLLKVTVLGIGKGKVRLGFEVADDISVQRLEEWERNRARVRIGPTPETRSYPRDFLAIFQPEDADESVDQEELERIIAGGDELTFELTGNEDRRQDDGGQE